MPPTDDFRTRQPADDQLVSRSERAELNAALSRTRQRLGNLNLRTPEQ